MIDAVNVDEDPALPPQEAPTEANDMLPDAAPVPGLAIAARPSDANLPSSSSGNALAAAGDFIVGPSEGLHACNWPCLVMSCLESLFLKHQPCLDLQ